MAGGLLQLVAIGAQDVYLTGNPQITFFKSVYRQYCSFGLETYEMSKFENIEYGSMDLGKECCVKVVSIEGTDLLRGAWLEVDVTNAGAEHVYGLGNALIKSVALEFNGTIIEEHTGGWLNTYGEMFQNNGKRRAWDTMVGNCVTGNLPKKLFVPLRFFFCTNNGTALPLCAMKQTPIKLKFHFATREELQLAPEAEIKITLWGDYVYIEDEERTRFISGEIQMLIEHVQIQEAVTNSSENNRIKLDFVNNIKCLYFTTLNQTCTSIPIHNTEKGKDTEPTFKLVMNGQDRMQEKGLDFFLRYMPYKYHVNNSREDMPIDIAAGESAYKHVHNQYIYMYSFALNAGDYQPSGTANLSRIDATQINIRNLPALPKNNMVIYAHGYNILKISGGVCQVLFPVEFKSERQRKLYL
jgi:hypothetical protein